MLYYELAHHNNQYFVVYRYFDDEDESYEGAYQPAPGSPGPQRKESSDSDEDPLDAFMAGIEQEVIYTSIVLTTVKITILFIRICLTAYV